ncbi:hypothetical protein EW145_g5983 [Phellinidium pouzarii]|uniref:3-hydroxyacyl-CoA dehydrogenase NAD binding domain-containing protein n=1 Tax=Phellinidium pouzarii TaxID=167371 RepID=A0A4V3XBZ6_9AGAM|nr:hypothetical protein EW145_g5983 [Phellinidium pouzarii]
MSISHGVKKLGVLGAGQMGLGIAYVAALRAKVDVLIYDKSTEQIERGLKLMDKLIAKDVANGKIVDHDAQAARARVTVVPQERGFAGLRDVDMVVEAVSENLSLKQKMFGSLAQELHPNAILASNTSSISITKIAAATIPPNLSAASEKGKATASRVVGLHFFNPVPKLVELISALQTSKETLGRARAFAIACGKEVTTSKDVPGFVSNALLMPFINEKNVNTGNHVSRKRYGFARRYRHYPKTGDEPSYGSITARIGLDTCLAIQQTLYQGTGDSKYRPSVLLERMVDAQWYGRKNGGNVPGSEKGYAIWAGRVAEFAFPEISSTLVAMPYNDSSGPNGR